MDYKKYNKGRINIMNYTKKSKVKLKTGIILGLTSLLVVCTIMIAIVSANSRKLLS